MKNPFYMKIPCCEPTKTPWYMGLSYRYYDPDQHVLVMMPFNVIVAILRNMLISLRRNFEIPMNPKDAYWQGHEKGREVGYVRGLEVGYNRCLKERMDGNVLNDVISMMEKEHEQSKTTES